MAAPIPCRMLEPTDRFERSLRRFTFTDKTQCPNNNNWGHNASVTIDTIEIPNQTYPGRGLLPDSEGSIRTTDERWPKRCQLCGGEFASVDQWQVNDERIYTGAADGGEYTRRNAPPGSMVWSPWYDDFYTPQLEHCLTVILPGQHEWTVDSQANNCPMTDDRAQAKHHCWVITGTLPNITVGKTGVTCSAGAGSILIPGWHGFLTNGMLVEC